ncbi:MAG: nucleoside monophosphate kinase [Verrucomicrobiota bacterium]|nr:nucleoside monophosphate kinase [Verrucomicrobiota bacterium]
MKYRSILLFGAPGAGKGTQGRILGAIPHFFHCACGDVFRSLSADSQIGRTFLEYSHRGELLPDDLTVELWRQQIGHAVRSGRFCPKTDSLVLDGIPRCIHQAAMLRDTLAIHCIFHLHCPNPKKLVQRIQQRALRENRLDDAKLEVIEARLKTYERDTVPLLNFYGKDRIHLIDATQAPHEVLRDILQCLHTANKCCVLGL